MRTKNVSGLSSGGKQRPGRPQKQMRKYMHDPPPTFARSGLLPSLDDAIKEAQQLVVGLTALQASVDERATELEEDSSEEEDEDEEDEHGNPIKVTVKDKDQKLTERTIRDMKRLVGGFKEEINLVEDHLAQKAYPVFPKLFKPLMPVVPELLNENTQNGPTPTRSDQAQSPSEAAPAQQQQPPQPPTPRRMSDPTSHSPGSPTMIIVKEPRVLLKNPVQPNPIVDTPPESRQSTSSAASELPSTAGYELDQLLTPISEPKHNSRRQSAAIGPTPTARTVSVPVAPEPEPVTIPTSGDDDDSDVQCISEEDELERPDPIDDFVEEHFENTTPPPPPELYPITRPPVPPPAPAPISDSSGVPIATAGSSSNVNVNITPTVKTEVSIPVPGVVGSLTPTPSNSASTSTILVKPLAAFLDDPKLQPNASKVILYRLPAAIEEQLNTRDRVKIPSVIEEEFDPLPSFQEEDEDTRNARLLRSALLGLQNWNKVREKKNNEQRTRARANAKARQKRPRRPRAAAQENDNDYSDLDMSNEEDEDPYFGHSGGPGDGGGLGLGGSASAAATGAAPAAQLGEGDDDSNSLSWLDDDEGNEPVDEGSNSDSEEEARRQLLEADDDEDAQNESQARSQVNGEPKASTSGPRQGQGQEDRRASLTTTSGVSDSSSKKRIRIHLTPLSGDTSESSDEDKPKRPVKSRRYPKRKTSTSGGGGSPPRKKEKGLVINVNTDSADNSEDEVRGTPRRPTGGGRAILSSSESDSSESGTEETPVRHDGEESSSISDGDSEIEWLELGHNDPAGPKPFPMPKVEVKKEKPDGDGEGTENAESKEDDEVVEMAVPSRRRFSQMAPAPEINLHSTMPVAESAKSRSKGRRDIQPIIPDSGLRLETQRAGQEEEERLERIRKRDEELERDEILKAFTSLRGFVLDPVPEPPVEVAHAIAKDLKDHQKEGIDFMWKACFETQPLALNTDGGGCILAHSMGLGKSLQVIALLHTVMRDRALGSKFKHVLVVCPKLVVRNWREEFKFWQKEIMSTEKVPVFVLSKNQRDALDQLRQWREQGGVGLVHYELMQNRCPAPAVPGVQVQPKVEGAQGAEQVPASAVPSEERTLYEECLCNPGPDVLVLDEGHILKNMKTLKYKMIARVQTKRKVILTGTPLQNNLAEFYAMMSLIKPALLGTFREFANRFVNPIENGQFSDSLPEDVERMKERTYVLTQLVAGCVHRKQPSLLRKELPPKHEYVIMVNLTSLQACLYNEYLNSLSPNQRKGKECMLANWQTFSKIMAHPSVVTRLNDKEKQELRKQRTQRARDRARARADRLRMGATGVEDDEESLSDEFDEDDPTRWEGRWYHRLLTENMVDIKSYELGAKLKVLRTILEICECTNEKVLVFSQFLTTLDIIEALLRQMHEEHEIEAVARGEGPLTMRPSFGPGFSRGTWRLGMDYSRLDGQTSVPDRENSVKRFNEHGSRVKLFLLCTRAGSLGINLIGANRVVVFDATWNPSHDLQGIHRVYRYGQTRECYIYRLVTPHTIEEKVFNNQIVKLSLAKRVVDERATERAIAKKKEAENMLYEQYPNPPPPPAAHPNPTILEADRVLGKLADDHPDLIYSIRLHKSLLQDDENLNDERRKLAMERYNKEKDVPPGVTTRGQAQGANAGGDNSKKPRPRGRPRKATTEAGDTAIQVPSKIWRNVAFNLQSIYPNDDQRRYKHLQRLITEGNTVSHYYKLARDPSKSRAERLAHYIVFQRLQGDLQDQFKNLKVNCSLHFMYPDILDLNTQPNAQQQQPQQGNGHAVPYANGSLPPPPRPGPSSGGGGCSGSASLVNGLR